MRERSFRSSEEREGAPAPLPSQRLLFFFPSFSSLQAVVIFYLSFIYLSFIYFFGQKNKLHPPSKILPRQKETCPLARILLCRCF